MDVYTDMVVATQLYLNNETILFTISCLFISFPFICVWMVSLRFVERYINEKQHLYNKHSNYYSKNNSNIIINKFQSLLLMIYLFPPIGCLIVATFELFWVIYDLCIGLSSLIIGKIELIDKNSAIISIKQFRKVIEFFGESLPETILQIYMFIFESRVSTSDLTISLTFSLFSLIYNCFKLRKEAKYHGMTFTSYAISVLQLGMFIMICRKPKYTVINK